MAYKTSYELHHNFPKIADEAGFTFNTHRPRVRIDWNKIKLIDTDNLVRERKFILIEQHLSDILDCIFESEFDVRILDEGVLKIFRLAQLTVEYQQFCRHYLDRSVYVLREEINSLAQELDVTKKELSDKTEEIKKLKRKTKHSYRTSLPYGNDNIASMILKTLTNKTDYFPTSTTGDSIQYNKCSYCDKVFMNQLYLKSHITRRHSHVVDIPQKDNGQGDQSVKNSPDNNILRNEVSQLKEKLGEMEEIIKKVNMQDNTNITHNDNLSEAEKTLQPNIVTTAKQMKDAEVSTNNEINVLDKIEEWKKEEEEKYNKEISLLRHQIMETIQTLKEKENTTNSTKSENNTIEQLNKTISQQGEEILSLKQELIDSQLRIEKEEAQRRKENEAQMTHWLKRSEIHAKQYESLLQKLNDVAKEAKESRTQVEAEKQRVAQLETMLQKSLNEKSYKDVNKDSHLKEHKQKELVKKSPAKEKYYTSAQKESNRQTLEQLHQKAQALLNIRSSSSSSSDNSSVEQDNNTVFKYTNVNLKTKPRMEYHKSAQNKDEINTPRLKSKESVIQTINKNGVPHQHKIKQKPIRTQNTQTVKNSTKIQKNGSRILALTPGSPMKIVRAKIMEEVNNRLITAGVDPLNSGLPKTNYHKQRTLIQQQDELKAKKNPSYEKAKHSILTYLDSKLPQNVANTSHDYVSPSKISKTFNLTSVISNVKNKALSLVKSNDVNVKDKRKLLSAEVSKRAMSLLNTPPDSTHSSPVTVKHKGIEIQSANKEQKQNNTPKSILHNPDTEKVNIQSVKSSQKETVSDDESNTSNQSDHQYLGATAQQISKSLEKLIKSPALPLSANSEYNKSPRRDPNNDNHLLRSQSATNIALANVERDIKPKEGKQEDSASESLENIPVEESVPKVFNNSKQTKSVLKNASSTSSLNKKKVLFDMDAIQMKSLSASPSQSITEKSDGNEKYELGLINLDGEEWDISSIENEPLNNDTNLRISTRTSPKIAELKQTIEAQLARRNDTPSTAIVGGVDILAGPMLRASSVAGSNTSLGSSILDDSEGLPPVINHKAFVKPKTVVHKYDSEIDLSEFSTDGIATNKHDDTF